MLQLKVVVVSMNGEGIIRCLVSVKKANNCEPSTEASKSLDDVKIKVQYRLWNKPQRCLITVAVASGV